MAAFGMFGAACEKSAHASAPLPAPKVDLAADKDAKAGQTHTVIVAGGCFWCVEAVFEQFQGVSDAVSGYAGGKKETASYKRVCDGDTNHAEAVKITYDPTKLTYGQLLQIFFSGHNPTTKDRQGNDAGTQYRSAIFYENEEQKKVAEAYIQQLNEAKVFDAPIVTTLEPLKADQFYVAEDYHQNYAACNIGNGYIRAVALPKVYKVREQFKDKLKPETQPAQK